MAATSQFHYLCYDNNITSVAGVLNHMQNIDEEITDTTFANLRAFNTTYFIITKHVFEKIGNNYFTNDFGMQKFDITFAYYYFNALRAYIDNKPVAVAWKIFFDCLVTTNRYQFIYMALGVNAHVNNDLAFALFDEETTGSNKHDFILVNSIIADALLQVINSLQENESFLYPLKNFYNPFLITLIKTWRSRAWNNYQQLSVRNNIETDIQQHAGTIATTLSTIKSHTDLLKLVLLFT